MNKGKFICSMLCGYGENILVLRSIDGTKSIKATVNNGNQCALTAIDMKMLIIDIEGTLDNVYVECDLDEITYTGTDYLATADNLVMLECL